MKPTNAGKSKFAVGLLMAMCTTQTAVRGDTRVPLGHILVCDRWQNTDLSAALQGEKNRDADEDISGCNETVSLALLLRL